LSHKVWVRKTPNICIGLLDKVCFDMCMSINSETKSESSYFAAFLLYGPT
jgi:hypothetical protein